MAKVRNYIDADYEEVKVNLIEADMFNPLLDSRENLRRKIETNPGSILVATNETDRVIGNIYLIEDFFNSFIFRLAVRETHR